MRRVSGWAATLLLLALFCGCAGSSHGGSPVDPGIARPPISAMSQKPPGSRTWLWGIWDFKLDPNGRDIAAVPLRGATFTCNVTHFVAGPPLEMYGRLVDLDFQPDFISATLDISLRNPFFSASYTGFDVIGVFMGDGSDVFPSPDAFSIPGPSDQLLLNTDGYTRWFNYPEFSGAGSVWKLFGYNAFDAGPSTYVPTAQLCPYKYYADGLGPTDDAFDFLIANSADRGSYAPQSLNTRRYEMLFPADTGITFKLAIVAHWVANINMPDPPGSLNDFPMAANADEALLVMLEDESTVYYISESEKGGHVRLKISPWDWSASITSTVVEEYQIRCYSDAWTGPYEVDMTPIYSAFKYHTFRTAIPVTDIHSMDPIPVWIEVMYPDLDYSNDFGVPNDAEGNLASYFYTEVPVLDYKPVWISVIQPNGGEELEVGKDYEIKWDSENLVGNIFIMFSLDDFTTDVHPIAVNEPNDGSFLWEDIPDMPSETVKVRVSSMKNSSINDRSDDYFTIYDSTEPFIRVVKPNGGELWKSGTSREIKWVSKNVPGNLFIEYSKDNFAGDIHIIAIDIPNTGSYMWQDIPYDLSETVRVRISSMLDPDIFDISDDDFTIDNPPIEVLSPDGGEEWKAGTSQEIVWETIDYTGNLDIEYSKDYFISDVHVIKENVADTGSYIWNPIPNDPSTTVRVRISSSNDPSVRDISDGNFSIEESGWGLSFGGSSNENGYSIALDSDGNIFVAGVFRGSNVDFDPDPQGVDYHSSNGGMDVFVCKFDPLADFLWARTWGGTGYDRGYSVAADPDGNAFVTGIFKGTNVDFDPDPAPSQKDLHSSIGGYDVFVSKFDPSGDFRWARTFGGTSDDNGFGIDTDQFGNAYTTGSFRGTVDFDPSAGVDSHTALGSSDIFLMALNFNGAFIWAGSWGGDSLVDYYDHGAAVAVGDFGDIYVTGNVAGDDIDFDPDPDYEYYLSALDGCDAFISRFDLSGNFEWGGVWGGVLDDYGFGLATDGEGNMYVTGRFEGMVDFDPGTGAEVYISSGAGYDAYLSKFNFLGDHQWARVWGAEDLNDYGWSVHAGGLDAVYVIGNFEGVCDFDPGAGIEELASNGETDIFLSSFNSAGWFNWARGWGGETAMDYGYGVWSDDNGNAFITGGITGDNVDFEPGDPVDPRDTYNTDVYIMKVMPDGEW